MAAFDPFEILGVSMGADDRTIKKAYRNLSPPSRTRSPAGVSPFFSHVIRQAWQRPKTKCERRETSHEARETGAGALERSRICFLQAS